jgi:hypothetical protein
MTLLFTLCLMTTGQLHDCRDVSLQLDHETTVQGCMVAAPRVIAEYTKATGAYPGYAVAHWKCRGGDV